MKAVHAYVSGEVQGVFFRQMTRQTARGLGIIGWVRNHPDGRVEVWAQGSDQAVDDLVAWLWQGPREARVTGVESEVVAPDSGLQDFVITN